MLNKRTIIGVLERSLATAWQAFFAVIVITKVTDLTALKIAGLAAAMAVGKYLSLRASAYLKTPEQKQ